MTHEPNTTNYHLVPKLHKNYTGNHFIVLQRECLMQQLITIFRKIFEF